MSFKDPELISLNNPKTCIKCKKHVNNARAISWESNVCPKCDTFKVEKQSIGNFNPHDMVVNIIIVTPMTVYLNRYTPYEMIKMKQEERNE